MTQLQTQQTKARDDSATINSFRLYKTQVTPRRQLRPTQVSSAPKKLCSRPQQQYTEKVFVASPRLAHIAKVMALRRSKRSTTIAATRKSAQEAAAPRQKRGGRQAGHGSKSNLTGTRTEPTAIQPTQPNRLGSEGQATVGGKRKRDDDATNTGVRTKRQLDAALTSSQPVPAREDQERRAAVAGKRKREDDVTQTGVGKKRQLEGSPLNARTAQLHTADQAILAEYDQASPPVTERIDPLRPTSRTETFPTDAEATPNATEGRKLLEALFAVVSKKRLLLQR